MRRRGVLTALLIAALIVAGLGWGSWWRDREPLKTLPFLRQRLTFLEAEKTRLQDLLARQHREAEETAARQSRADIENVVSGLRGLKFLRPVVYREIPRSKLPAILRQRLSQQVPDQEFARTSVAFAALGLVPAGLDLKKTYLALLGEQVGAFYDQHNRELFTFSGQSLASSQNRIILAHELTHAMEDQHFNLERLPLEAKGNDDRALAASALVEGDATLVMNRYLLGNLSADVLRENLAATMTTDVRQLAVAPRFLRETLLFPYLKGQEFCQALFDRGGWDELGRAFVQPPASTSQILHPEHFLSALREEPASVEWEGVTVRGSAPGTDNVLGEFGLRQLLIAWLRDERRAAALAGGWRGDRYLVYGDTTASSYVWETLWRLPGQAEEFARTVSASHPVRSGRFTAMVDATHRRVLLIDAQDASWEESLKANFSQGFTPVP